MMKKLALLHHFASVAQIRKADAEALDDVRGLNKHDVVAILAYFDQNSEPDKGESP